MFSTRLRAAAWKAAAVVGYAVQYGCIAHCTLEYAADFIVCSGPSMEPTIHTQDILITEKFSVMLKTVDVGDVVIARSPTNPNIFICKRVAGMEGDKVCLNPGSFIKKYRWVPRGHVWLVGDNMANSSDSRVYGAVPYALLRSKVVFKVWPPGDSGSLRGPPQEMLQVLRTLKDTGGSGAR
ncbi:IMMP1L [Branchiostoma lanceolatum]|uniref:Mitochondrial inner membrane protease subunit n=1 Tax=Branchiostoma lanceolatum TaxID=7740 RepID=A0A8J9ZMF4_BRALA|nr:IMMP1L [Branchiostoma lanceolatum]